MNKVYSLVLTFICGITFLIGGLITYRFKNKDKLNYFSSSLALVIMLGLIGLDLLPEALELLEDYKLLEALGFLLVFTILGFLILKILDLFIPDHHHEHKDNEKNHKEHVAHIKHIGLLTVISLILHNLLEGFMIIGLGVRDLKLGILTMFTVMLHNIPLGTHIFSAIDLKDNKLIGIILSLSSFIGGLIFLLIGVVNKVILALVTSLSLGMMIYIAIFELLPEVLVNKNKKETFIGIILGVIILLVSLFI